MKNIKKLLVPLVTLASMMLSPSSLATTGKPLIPLSDFGTNPGELSASYFMPHSTSQALVVLLHGCTQVGEKLAQDIGLLDLAKAHNFSVLIPQQSNSNNITTCFNWFSPQDSDKDQGETLSIKQMIDAMLQNEKLKNEKLASVSNPDVFIVGLSAGGAMSASLMMHYPDMFAAGAVVAGIPYPCADGLIKAISCMKNGPASNEELITAAKTMHSNVIPLPRLTVWTGDSDKVVSPQNAAALANQWQVLLNLDNTSANANSHYVENKSHQNKVTTKQWLSQSKQTVLELVTIAELDHGFPVNPTEKLGGKLDKYLLQAPIAAMPKIINFFELDKK